MLCENEVVYVTTKILALVGGFSLLATILLVCFSFLAVWRVGGTEK
jgi:hypothetical protein